MESIIWTGNNVNAVTEFAENHEFNFSVGSSHGRYKWYHRFADRLSYPRDDKTVLEIFPNRPKEGIDKFHEDNSGEDLAKLLKKLQDVHDGFPVFSIIKVKEIFDIIEHERGDIYHPWHWTTAKPGDRIFADGTVERDAV